MIKGYNKIDIIEVLIFRRFFFKIKPKTNTPLLQLTLKLQGGAHLCQQHVLIRITPKSSKIEQQPFYIVTVDQQHISVSSTPKMLKIEYQTSARGFTVCKFWSVEKIVGVAQLHFMPHPLLEIVQRLMAHPVENIVIKQTSRFF